MISKENKKKALERCIWFLRSTADAIEKGSFDADMDPVGVLIFTDEGPLLFVPSEYAEDAEKLLEDGFQIRGYSRSMAS